MEENNGSVRRRRHRRNRSDVVEQELSILEKAETPVTKSQVSSRIQAKTIKRREQKQMVRQRHSILESDFLAKRENVDRKMLIDSDDFQSQIAVIEDGILVEFYITKETDASIVSNIYVGVVQNVLPSMESAFIDIGTSRNAVLYAGEVAWDVSQLEGKPKMIENSLKEGDKVIVQVTKDSVSTKGPRLTSQITLPGKYLVLVPSGGITGISRRIAQKERDRLKKIVAKIAPAKMGVIVRTAAEGVSEAELQSDLNELVETYKNVYKVYEQSQRNKSPQKIYEDVPTQIRVIRDVFNDDFNELIVSGEYAAKLVDDYLQKSASKYLSKVKHYEGKSSLFHAYKIEDQIYKAMNRKILLPSGGSIIIDHTEAMTVIDVNTGRNTGGGTMENTITKNNLEAAQEIVNQLRLRDVGGIVVIDFIDMMLKSNQDKVLTRFIECLSRDRTRHQVSEITSLGLVQMTRKRRGPGLAYQMDVVCKECRGTGFLQENIFVLGTTDKDKQQRYETERKVIVPDKERAHVAATIAASVSS
ncbi:MAG: Rne/Rng family ribonuclease [Bifidobacteriaceae bacterium]|jgi:ribonuclease E|nr:Rne/Rng family ribonuclease [Bifidobacteriaceae bacterium]